MPDPEYALLDRLFKAFDEKKKEGISKEECKQLENKIESAIERCGSADGVTIFLRFANSLLCFGYSFVYVFPARPILRETFLETCWASFLILLTFAVPLAVWFAPAALALIIRFFWNPVAESAIVNGLQAGLTSLLIMPVLADWSEQFSMLPAMYYAIAIISAIVFGGISAMLRRGTIEKLEETLQQIEVKDANAAS